MSDDKPSGNIKEVLESNQRLINDLNYLEQIIEATKMNKIPTSDKIYPSMKRLKKRGFISYELKLTYPSGKEEYHIKLLKKMR